MTRPSLLYRLAWTLPAFALLAWALSRGPTVHPRVGNVVHVVDGDTLLVHEQGRPLQVRISRIDCPELDQPFGLEAQRFVDRLLHGQTVRLEAETRDRYGRTIARVYLPDGRSVAEELLHAGLAWHFRQYSRDPALDQLEAGARNGRLGLWSAPEAIPPWRWRHTDKVPR